MSEYFGSFNFEDLEDLKQVKDSDLARELSDFYDYKKDTKSEDNRINNDDRINNNDIALVRRNGNENMRKDSDATDYNSDDHKDFKGQHNENKSCLGDRKKSLTSNDQFDNLFHKCTIRCDGDGNCFILSALNILGKKINHEEMLNLRLELQKTYGNLFNNQEYKERYVLRFNKDYKGLEKNKEWVEIEPGVVSLAKYMQKPFAVLSRSIGVNKNNELKTTFNFSIANKNGELKLDCSLNELKKEIIENKISTIVLNDKHYQALKDDSDSRNNFLNVFFELFIDQSCEDIKQSIKTTNEAKETALLNSIPTLLSGSENQDLLRAKVLSVRYSTIDTTEKEEKLFGIVEEVRAEAKKSNIDKDYLNIKYYSEVFDHADKNNDLSSVLDFDIIRDNRISNYKDKKNKEEKSRSPKKFVFKKKEQDR